MPLTKEERDRLTEQAHKDFIEEVMYFGKTGKYLREYKPNVLYSMREETAKPSFPALDKKSGCL